MESMSYIRHRFGKEREVSTSNDVFATAVGLSESYQDVLSFSVEDGEKNLTYTVGKHIFPSNREVVISMNRWMIMLLADGEMWCGSQQLFKGDFVVIPSACAQDFHTRKEGAVFYWYTANDEAVINIMKNCGYRDNECVVGHAASLKGFIDVFEHTIYKFPVGCDTRIYLVGRLICLSSFISMNVAKKQEMSDHIFKRCLRRIDVQRGNITVDELAKHYFISRRYLYTMFKDYMNMSPMDYILKVRMEVADKYLISTEYSISKIAELTGYSSYSHFTRAYTKYFSVSPSKRRHEARVKDISEENNTFKKKMLLDE